MEKQITLNADLSMKIDRIIKHLKDKTQPESIVLADISGQLIAYTTIHKDLRIENLAALFASNMGANAEIASEIYEMAGFDCNLHEGKDYCIFISRVRTSFILAVIFKSVEAIGMVRLFTKRACKELDRIVVEFERQVNVKKKKRIDDNFTNQLSKKIDDLFDIDSII